jgi:hypothetical protein
MKYNTTCVGLLSLFAENQHGNWGVENNPVCHLCADQKGPGNIYGAAAILLPGKSEGTIYRCTELYTMGRQGKITAQMCRPIRYFMNAICECGTVHRPTPWVAIRPPRD